MSKDKKQKQDKKQEQNSQQQESLENEEPRQDLAQEIRQELEKLEQENADLLDKLRRVSADYDNFQKRVPRQVADTVAYEREKIIKSLLPALDNFEHALANAEKAENPQAVAEGVKMVYNQMLDILKSHGVEQIKAKGQDFNPSHHQAIMKQHDPDKKDNVVLEEFQRGYKLNDRLIRPSRVVVNKIESSDQQEQTPEKEENETE